MEFRDRQFLRLGRRHIAFVVVALASLMLTSTGAAQAKRTSGTAGADRIVGTAKADVIKSGAGNDRIDGRAGGDRLSGGRGSDRLTGGPGRDRLPVTADVSVERLPGGVVIGLSDRVEALGGTLQLTGAAQPTACSPGASLDMGDTRRPS